MNDNVNMNEPATEEELKNVGFIQCSNLSHIYWLNCFGFQIRYEEKHIKVFDMDDIFILRAEAPTKTELNKMLYPFIKRELDFSTKEKMYSLKECFDREGWVNNCGVAKQVIAYANCINSFSIVYKTEAQCNQAIAIAQLSHIIAEIDKDYPSDRIHYRYNIYFDKNSKSILCGGESNRYCTHIVSVESREGVEILIKKHPELIKIALMVL